MCLVYLTRKSIKLLRHVGYLWEELQSIRENYNRECAKRIIYRHSICQNDSRVVDGIFFDICREQIKKLKPYTYVKRKHWGNER
jgi:hypothetical protein